MSTKAQSFDGWVKGLIRKWPVSALAILAALCEAGLKRGTASANDTAGVVYSDPHVVGAVFKVLARVGFVKGNEIIASTRPKSNASFVLVWTLVDPSKARQFLDECRSVLCKQEGKAETQCVLNL